MNFGHLRWKVTDVVRVAKVSRPLLYRYFGSTKEQILQTALGDFTTEFYGFYFDPKLKFVERVERAHRYASASPEAVIFYLTWRNKPSKFKKDFMKIESQFQTNIKSTFPKLTDKEVLTMHCFLHGIVTSPFLATDDVASVFKAFGPY